MQNLNFLETEFLDILFQGKNKNYGAYTLRKFYPQRLHTAFMVTAAAVLSLFTLHFLIQDQLSPPVIISCPIPDVPGIKLISIALPPGDIADAGRVIQPANPDIPTRVVQDTKAASPVQKPIAKANPQPFSPQAGPGEGTNIVPNGGGGGVGPGEVPSGLGTARAAATPPVNNDYVVVPVAQIMPQFPGGEKALEDFLRKNIKYPTMAKKLGTTGTVYIEFVVNTLGKISDIKIVHGIGSGCDAETMRVVKSMPTWIPGQSNGSKVNVSYTLPVTFEFE